MTFNYNADKIIIGNQQTSDCNVSNTSPSLQMGPNALHDSAANSQ